MSLRTFVGHGSFFKLWRARLFSFLIFLWNLAGVCTKILLSFSFIETIVGYIIHTLPYGTFIANIMNLHLSKCIGKVKQSSFIAWKKCWGLLGQLEKVHQSDPYRQNPKPEAKMVNIVLTVPNPNLH